MERHLKDLLSALNAREVKYVVVGSYALAVMLSLAQQAIWMYL